MFYIIQDVTVFLASLLIIAFFLIWLRERKEHKIRVREWEAEMRRYRQHNEIIRNAFRPNDGTDWEIHD